MRKFQIHIEPEKIPYPVVLRPVIEKSADRPAEVVIHALVTYGDALVFVTEEEKEPNGEIYTLVYYSRDGDVP